MALIALTFACELMMTSTKATVENHASAVASVEGECALS
jgi:hypothetical protein